MEETKKGEIIIYKDQFGPAIQVDFIDETVWLSQSQMADLFQKDRDTISEHIQNVYKEAELSQKQTTRKFRAVQTEGKKQVEREVSFYNLDVVISVGYRVKSKRGTQFRIWATQRLKDYLVKGFAVNQKRLKDFENLQVKLKDLEGAHKLISQALESKRLDGYEKELLRIITDYANTWFVLNQYDKGELTIEDVSQKKTTFLKYEEIQKSISKFRERLEAKKEAGDLFGKEVGGKLQGVLGSIGQTFSGKDLYPSIEEKAAHLLYFCVKDHPFADGNKRIGSLLFLLFLLENNCLVNRRGERKVNDIALTALALLIAESKPQDKEVMVKLVVNLINKK